MPRCVARRISRQALADHLERFCVARLEPLRHRWELAGATQYTLALIGLTNVGKSTILRALFGADIAIRGAGPTTPFPIRYQYGNEWKLAIARAGSQIGRSQHRSTNEVASAVRELVQNAPPDVNWLRVTGPLDILRGGLQIADTPGFGAAQTGPNEGQHQARLEGFLMGPIHQIFLCVAASDAWVIRPEEQKYYERFNASCGDVIVTKWRGSESEQREYTARYRSLFPHARFHFTNAKRAIAREGDHSHADLDDGLPQLRARIESAADPASRSASCHQDLTEAWQDLHDDLAQQYDLRYVPWHEFEYGRLLAGVPNDSALGALLNKEDGGIER
jgi:GTP-binding protein EngB required for normal cell division